MNTSRIENKNVVVTGAIPGHSRGTVQALLQDAGANIQSSMSASTEVLVVGGAPGPKKIEKAASLGIEVIDWDDLVSGNGSSERPAPVAPLKEFRTISPQLALAADLPSDEGWQFELKYDGYRCVSAVRGGAVAMQSRSGKSEYAAQFPKVAAALAQLPNVVLDGELLVTLSDGSSSFATTHQAATGTESYVVFDVLELNGEDCRRFSLRERRELLEALCATCEGGPIRISQAVADGKWLLAWATEQKQEGVVAKRLSSRYIEGSRTSDWLKIKVRLQNEFLICGFTKGTGGRASTFGALILARYGPDGELVAAGKCGTGFDEPCLYDLRDRMLELEARELPPHFPRELRREGVGIEPVLVAEIEYQRQTTDGSLWHPSFKRLRFDKPAREVVVEP